jgi:hypothetical protein
VGSATGGGSLAARYDNFADNSFGNGMNLAFFLVIPEIVIVWPK